MHETTHSRATAVSPDQVKPRSEYRTAIREQLQEAMSKIGPTGVVDSCNHMEQLFLEHTKAGVTVQDTDILLDELRSFFDEHYPPISRSRHQGWLPVRLATHKHL